MGRLLRLELENFKSYYGKQIVGPFDENFVSVIGPNGAGKSNLMDAISFVLGIQSAHLRSHQLVDLIYRRSSEDRPASHASVVLVYMRENGMETVFSRKITATGSSEYRIDGKVVPYAEYVRVWAGENVLIKARNFLVFQGDVEAIANKSPKELTRLLEQISGSEEYREEYDRCKLALDKATEESALNFNKKRGIGAELKLVHEQKEDVLRFEKLIEQKAAMQSEYYLWKLFHVEEASKRVGSEIEKKETEVRESEEAVQMADSGWKELKKKQAKCQKDLLVVEKQVKMAQKKVQDEVPRALQIEERVKHVKQRMLTLADTKKRALEDLALQEKEILSAERELKEVMIAADQFEKNATAKLQAASISPAMLEEYNELREIASERTAKERLKFESLQRKMAPSVAMGEQLRAKQRELASAANRIQGEIDELAVKETKVIVFG